MSVNSDPRTEPTAHPDHPHRAEPRRHPALDFRFRDPGRLSDRPVDKVVFGVTAALAVAFLVWGFVSTESLSSASTDGPSPGVMRTSTGSSS